MSKILQADNEVLRKIAKSIPLPDITSNSIQSDIAQLQNALNSQDDGLAIAGPQIGISKRIFIISGRIKDPNFVKGNFDSEKKYEQDMIFINPEIIKNSKKTVNRAGEGCLSVRWIYGTVKRFTNVTVKYHNEKGEEKTLQAGGIIGHIIQHEIDHLNGILFIDKAKKLEEVKPDHFHGE